MKKKIIGLSIILILSIGLGLFLWNQSKTTGRSNETSPTPESTIELSQTEKKLPADFDYSKIEIPNEEFYYFDESVTQNTELHEELAGIFLARMQAEMDERYKNSESLFGFERQYGADTIVKVNTEYTPKVDEVLKLSFDGKKNHYARVSEVETEQLNENEPPESTVVTASLLDVDNTDSGNYLIYVRDDKEKKGSGILAVTPEGHFHISIDESGSGIVIPDNPAVSSFPD